VAKDTQTLLVSAPFSGKTRKREIDHQTKVSLLILFSLKSAEVIKERISQEERFKNIDV